MKNLETRLAQLEQQNKKQAEQIDYLERQVQHHDNMISMIVERADTQYELWALTNDKAVIIAKEVERLQKTNEFSRS